MDVADAVAVGKGDCVSLGNEELGVVFCLTHDAYRGSRAPASVSATAICVASAVLLILELSDPYSGLFRMPHESFDGLVRLLTNGAGKAADAET